MSDQALAGIEAAAQAPQPQEVVQQGQLQQQQQQPQPQQQPLIQNQTPIVNSAGENLQCQWQGCGERCSSPEALYVSTRRIIR